MCTFCLWNKYFNFRTTQSSWSEDTHPVHLTTFVEPVGPSTILPPTNLGIFKLFFTTALIGAIVEQTNLYARQMLGEAGDQWKEVTAEDMQAFLGVSLMMGLNKVPSLHQYWSQKDLYYNKAIASKISRDRFLAILRYIHFVENNPPNTTTTDTSRPSPLSADQLWKVRPVISAILDACQSNYHPHREQAIDEAMVGFKGRSCIKQYIPKKPIKRGF